MPVLAKEKIITFFIDNDTLSLMSFIFFVRSQCCRPHFLFPFCRLSLGEFLDRSQATIQRARRIAVDVNLTHLRAGSAEHRMPSD